MADVFYLKRGDTLPVLSVVFLNPDRSPFNLTGYAVTLYIQVSGGGVISRTMSVPTPTNGEARYAWVATDWTAADKLLVGTHRMEYRAVNGAAVLTFPREHPDVLQVYEDIAL